MGSISLKSLHTWFVLISGVLLFAKPSVAQSEKLSENGANVCLTNSTTDREQYKCCKGWSQVGNQCTKAICIQPCVNGTCTKPDYCSCNKGYHGHQCERNVDCPLDKWGPQGCTNDCHCLKNEMCSPQTGQCVGFIGLANDGEDCKFPYYGENCQYLTICYNGASPAPGGKCICADGYYGESFRFILALIASCSYSKADGSTGCPPNQWGPPGCQNSCICFNGASCNPANGKCLCSDGYQGNNCNDTCREGTYGFGCKENCTCPINTVCSPIDGSCSCIYEYEYNRTHCQCQPKNSVCSQWGTYNLTTGKWNAKQCQAPVDSGQNFCKIYCENKNKVLGCQGNCECQYNAKCYRIDGSCDCLPGWTGDNCSTACQYGRFGKNCQSVCTCGKKTKCDHVTGKCIDFPTTSAEESKPLSTTGIIILAVLGSLLSI